MHGFNLLDIQYCLPTQEQPLIESIEIQENGPIKIVKKKYKQKTCNHPNCEKQPSYNFITEKVAIFCKDHKLIDMKDIVNKRCNHDGCDKRPNYNYPTETSPIFCKDHKLINMENITSKRCNHDGCEKQPSYNFITETVAIFCKDHKLINMKDIKNKRCNHDGCDKQPYFNYPTEKVAIFCKDHKLIDMKDIKNKRCNHDGCDKNPLYNYPTETVAIFCKDHKLIDMKDIRSKRCNHDGCDKRPLYNYPTETSPIFCKDHKLIDMEDIKNKRCNHDGCDKRPNYNYPTETVAIFCKDHKLIDMEDIKHKRCKTDLCDTFVSNKNYEGHCLRCFMFLFPDKPVARNYKTKETFVADFIKESFPNDEWIFDKTIVNGTSRRRPDILLEMNTYNIIIEIDENQHRDYDDICENKRMMEIFQDLGNRNIVFIRFNPDDYLDNDKNITSCWWVNKQSICVVKKSKAKEWTQRLDELKNQIEYWMHNFPEKEVEIVHLFYDK
jgi:hypothetical protein